MFCFFQFLSRYFKTFYAFELKSLKAYLYFTIISSNDAIWWTNLPLSIRVYIISSVMHAFWLVLTYDLLEDRRIDDVIIKIFFWILYYIKQIDSKWLFCSYHILTSSMTYHWTDARQLGIYLLNRPTATTSNLFVLYSKEAKNLSR